MKSLTAIRKVGRPTKYCPEVVETICEAISDGAPFKYAAAIGGISIDTFCQWRKKFPEFSEAIEAAVAEGVHARLKIILEAAEEGSLKAATWWLEHVMPEHFSRNSVNFNHRIEGAITHSATVSKEALAAIAETRARYERKKSIEE